MIKKKKSKIQQLQEETQAAINKTNEHIDNLGKATSSLYTELCNIQEVFDEIRNVPNEKKLQYEELKQIRLNWKQQVDKIEKDYNAAVAKKAGVGAAGAGIGVAVVAFGPTVAMGVATTFGVASTGTAIAALHGAAATNAALAWLGGGTLLAGGGGMAAGKALLALAGPVGWAIAGVALVASGIFIWKSHSDKKHLEDIFTLISKRDITSYESAIVELNERIERINIESINLHEAIDDIKTFGLDYNSMTESQQYTLGAYVNLMFASTQLLVNPIAGLLPKYTEEDFDVFISYSNDARETQWYLDNKLMIVSLSNLLYKIEINDRDKKLLWKSFKKNKKMLEYFSIKKKDFSIKYIDTVIEALNYKYTCK